jgi:DNA-binding response OmpR family regulator
MSEKDKAGRRTLEWPSMRVLFVEDDPRMRALVQRGLAEQGHAVDVAEASQTALSLTRQSSYDVMVFDVMLPGPSGLDLTRSLRQAGNRTPILMLTARDAAADIVSGLDAGADDYLAKPFAFSVLLARLRALSRRPPIARSDLLSVADLRLDVDSHSAMRGELALPLTRTEYSLLECLMRRPGRVVTREQLMGQLWSGRDVSSNTLDAFVKSLRHKLEADNRPKLLHTIRGIGYAIREEPEP